MVCVVHEVTKSRTWVSLVVQMVKNLPAMRDLIPGSGRSPREGNGYPLQDSCLENSKDRGGQQSMGSVVSDSTERLTAEQLVLLLFSLGFTVCPWGARHPPEFLCFVFKPGSQ